MDRVFFYKPCFDTKKGIMKQSLNNMVLMEHLGTAKGVKPALLLDFNIVVRKRDEALIYSYFCCCYNCISILFLPYGVGSYLNHI